MENRLFTIATLFFSLLPALSLSQAQAGEIKLTSPAFKHNKYIPARFSCEGADINPQLDIAGMPAGTKSLALIVDDPDAPMGTWVHWVVYNIPLISSIGENTAPGKLGKNSFNRVQYGGPCPPSGTHRYFFKIYALDRELAFNSTPSKQDLEKAMQAHILARGEIIGLYAKGR
jgi:Raf kinase inhibitor-like YbhB/YbcL family protein